MSKFFGDKKGMSTLMMVLEILLILFAAYSIFSLASNYTSSESTNKIILADDIKMMIDTLVGTPGEAVVQYPGNVSKYTIVLGSSSVSVFIKGEGDQQKVVRYFSLPQGYQAFGTVDGKDTLCLEKDQKNIILRDCKASVLVKSEEKLPGFEPVETGPSFYGIPITGDKIVFVIDHSISMQALSEWKFAEAETTIKKNGDRKLDIAAWQLKIALEQLPDGKSFNIIFFNSEFDTAFPTLQELNSENRMKAYEFADGLDAIGGTNIYAPLSKALTYEGVDIIFLLTDGRSYEGISDPDVLIQKIEEDNVNKVKINTIGVFTITGQETSEEKNDKEIGIKLLKGLAEQNDGVFAFQGDDNNG